MKDDDVVFEDLNEEGEEKGSHAKVKKIREELIKAQEEAREHLTALQRERADFLNYKKDEAKRYELLQKRSRERFAEELLPVLDAYDMAFSNKEAWEAVDKNWRTGIEYIHQQLIKILSENGVEEIKTNEGDQFDPTLHQSVESIPTEDQRKDNTIEKILQKGYQTRESVIRPVRVNVFTQKK